MSLPPKVLEAIRRLAREHHTEDPQRWQAVIATARVMRNMDKSKAA